MTFKFTEDLLEYGRDTDLILAFMDIVCGEYIASGSSRDVYECTTNKKWVVKIQKQKSNYENILEWTAWLSMRYSIWEKWFAPCRYVSDNGRILIQDRVKPLTDKTRPKEVPAFFTDLKDENFGTIGNQVVACDYAFTYNRLISINTTKRMIKFR